MAINTRRANVWWAMLVFVILFLGLLALVARWYILPATAAYQDADAVGRRGIAAYSALVMALLLLILAVGLWSVWRLTRPHAVEPRQPTKYVDAWAEAGRRLRPPDDEDPP